MLSCHTKSSTRFYSYKSISNTEKGQGVVGLDLGTYREKGFLKIYTDRSDEIGLLLGEYINVIKAQLAKKEQTESTPGVRDCLSCPSAMPISSSGVSVTRARAATVAERSPRELFLTPPIQVHFIRINIHLFTDILRSVFFLAGSSVPSGIISLARPELT